MDFIDRVRELAANARKRMGLIQTEEATKNALIMPFISTVLEYDVFDPSDVVPEFTADVGVKKGEKVDYAILKGGKPVILIECKCVGSGLNLEQATQLYHYFSVTEARFGVLTDGIIYRFHSDIEQPNKMDLKPFFEFSLFDFDESHVDELKKFSKSSFDLEGILTTRNELKYKREIAKILAEEWSNPSDDFVRFFASLVYPGHKTQAVIQQFKPIAKSAFQQFIRDRIKDKLNSAFADDTDIAAPSGDIVPVVEGRETVETANIETTEEETQGYYIVKTLLRDVVEPKRISMRDAKSYCAILLDDNNRKPICRLYFDGRRRQLGIFDQQKAERRVPLESLDDIYKHADALKATPGYYQPI